jgi:hypothetical protein
VTALSGVTGTGGMGRSDGDGGREGGGGVGHCRLPLCNGPAPWRVAMARIYIMPLRL